MGHMYSAYIHTYIRTYVHTYIRTYIAVCNSVLHIQYILHRYSMYLILYTSLVLYSMFVCVCTYVNRLL